MPLRPLTDLSAADWILRADGDWWTTVCLGPPGFEAYSRVWPWPEDDDAINTFPVVQEVLARHTRDPKDGFAALWDGWGGFEGGPQDTGLRLAVPLGSSVTDIAEARRLTAEARLVDCAPAFDPAFLRSRKLSLPHRDYYLFAGPVDEPVDWGEVDFFPGNPRGYETIPALMWPADRAWCVAADVDPDWIGVGGTQALVDELVADERLDAEHSPYDATDWEDR